MLWGNGLGSRPLISSPFGWRVHPVTGVRKLARRLRLHRLRPLVRSLRRGRHGRRG